MRRFGSSYRACSLEQTLERAAPYVSRFGISRITDITRLDMLGVPVFASVRPAARAGSLCVNAGKGLTAAEARVGACMESIEFALAEPAASRVSVIEATARNVLDGWTRPDAILDLCPIYNMDIALDEPMDCVVAEDVCGGACLVPAELVFLPCPIRSGRRGYFGSNSTGLASGNTVLEALVHGLFEVIERDITSFRTVMDSSLLVTPASFPSRQRGLWERVEDAGFRLCVRTVPNPFRVSYFAAALYERGNLDPAFVNLGYGCHIDPGVALTRAITEAAQSRLSFIHGARDDLPGFFKRFASWSAVRKRGYVRRAIQIASNADAVTSFDEVARLAVACNSLEEVFGNVCEALRGAGFLRVLRVGYTEENDAIQVVRAIVPGLEAFTPESRRIGKRLAEYLAASA